MGDSKYEAEYPVHHAVRIGNAKKVESLLTGLLEETQVIVNKVDDKGNVPLSYALCNRNAALLIVEILLIAGANVDAQDRGGNTVLHDAALFKQKEIVERLLEEGANPLLINKDGKTPADLAGEDANGFARKGATELSELLERAEKKQRATNKLFCSICGAYTNKLISNLISEGGDINGTRKFDPNGKGGQNIGRNILTHLTQLYINNQNSQYLSRIRKTIELGGDPDKLDDHRNSSASIIQGLPEGRLRASLSCTIMNSILAKEELRNFHPDDIDWPSTSGVKRKPSTSLKEVRPVKRLSTLPVIE